MLNARRGRPVAETNIYELRESKKNNPYLDFGDIMGQEAETLQTLMSEVKQLKSVKSKGTE